MAFEEKLLDVTACHINVVPFQMEDIMSYKEGQHCSTKTIFCSAIQTTFFKVHIGLISSRTPLQMKILISNLKTTKVSILYRIHRTMKLLGSIGLGNGCK